MYIKEETKVWNEIKNKQPNDCQSKKRAVVLSWSSYFERSLLFLYVQLFIVQILCAYIIKELGVGEREDGLYTSRTRD
jgi:hypothetical protein